jgi:mono/diheme cytochrome c family protein
VSRFVRAALALAAVGAGGCTIGKKTGSDGPDVRPLFASVCAKCHGLDGKGGIADVGGVRPRNFCDAEFQRTRTDEELEKAILEGKNNRMPSFAGVFSPDQVKGLVRYIRSFDPGATPGTVTK